MSGPDFLPEQPRMSLDDEWALWQGVDGVMDEACLKAAEELGPRILEATLKEIKNVQGIKDLTINNYAEPAIAQLERYANVAFEIERDVALFVQSRGQAYDTVKDFLAHQNVLDELHAKSSGWGATPSLSGNGYANQLAPLEDRLAEAERMDGLVGSATEWKGCFDVRPTDSDSYGDLMMQERDRKDDPNDPNNQ